MNHMITLSKAALIENFRFLKGLFNPKVRISSVVKGNAYGHGVATYVPMAESLGINHFSVYSSQEARELAEIVKPDTEIMIMGYMDPDDLEWAIAYGVSFFVFDFHRLEQSTDVARKLGRKARIHIELETGMNRTGFSEKDIDEVALLLKKNHDVLEFTGLCTHFAGAESITNHVRVQEQKERFNKMNGQFNELDLKPELRHTCCSAASIRMPEMHMDMVRIGIMQYGFWPSREIFIEYLKGRVVKTDPLKRLIRWESRIMSIKDIEMGEFIGYGTSYLAQKDMQIAVVPIGYSHGFSRALSNAGRVLVNGVRTAVIGIVNMNCFTIDVTDIVGVAIDDVVTLIGQDGEYEISVASFGELSEQVNYELLTRLPANIHRKVN